LDFLHLILLCRMMTYREPLEMLLGFNLNPGHNHLSGFGCIRTNGTENSQVLRGVIIFPGATEIQPD
jgi:hypothetical protein